MVRAHPQQHAACAQLPVLHGIVGKALSSASSFLVPHNRTRRPYLAVPDAVVARFLKRADFPKALKAARLKKDVKAGRITIADLVAYLAEEPACHASRPIRGRSARTTL